MNCPLQLYKAGTTGTVDYYYSPCSCTKLCEYTSCKYRRNGFLVQFSSLGTTTTNTVSLIGTQCGGSAPLVAESTVDVLTNAGIAAGTIYRIYPVTINNVLRFTVAGL